MTSREARLANRLERIYPEYTYSDEPRSDCLWDETAPAPNWSAFGQDAANGDSGGTGFDVAIVGGGLTGASAALHLAEAGASVAVLEAREPGWGASGRNGGFCCIGSTMRDAASLERQFGREAAEEFRIAEIDAIGLVESLVDRLGIDADRHSAGETMLAHRPSAMRRLHAKADEIAETAMILARRRGGAPPSPCAPGRPATTDPVATGTAPETGLRPKVLGQEELAEAGLGGPFHGAVTIPWGFAINPRKYLFGLAAAATKAGARFFRDSPVTSISRAGGGWELRVADARLRCDRVVIATNGYSSEDVPGWMAARYMPAQSAVMATRPMTSAELAAQGWHSRQMCFDSRNLLHYFSLLPDRRMLFGMRGGPLGGRREARRERARLRADFERMFPAWKRVETAHAWSGLICATRSRAPFVGPVPGHPGLLAGFAFHGNGVAMGTYAGRVLAGLALEDDDKPALQAPRVMREIPGRIPLGRHRRLALPLVHAALALEDLVG